MENKISPSRMSRYLNACTIFYFSILFCILLTSCNNLPADLQSRKDACITKLNDLSNRDKNASSSEYNQLMQEYSELKDEVISYTAECNKRGIRKENDKLISELNEKISKYKKLTNSDNGYNGSTTGKGKWVPRHYINRQVICHNCPGASCTHCFGRGWYYSVEEVEGHYE